MIWLGMKNWKNGKEKRFLEKNRKNGCQVQARRVYNLQIAFFMTSKSDYQQSLEFLLSVYNSFLNQAKGLLYPPSPLSYNLQKALAIWVHPKGISNLVRTFTLQYESSETLIKAEPSCQQQLPRLLVPQPTKDKNLRVRSFRQPLIKQQVKEEGQCDEQEDYSDDDLSLKEEEEEIQSEFNESANKEYKRGPYKSYTMEEKMEAVRLFMTQKISITEISRNLGIPCKNIKRWATDGIYRKRGGGRRRTNPGLEQEVHRWVNCHHPVGDTIRIEEIQEYALSRSKDSMFKASRGWAIKFIDRYNLRSRFLIN